MATNKKELMMNAAHWMEQAKAGGLGKYGIGAIFIFFDTTADGSAVATANVDKKRIAAECRSIVKKIEGGVIISPFDN